MNLEAIKVLQDERTEIKVRIRNLQKVKDWPAEVGKPFTPEMKEELEELLILLDKLQQVIRKAVSKLADNVSAQLDQ